MMHCQLDELDIQKLEQARNLVEEVYYMGANSSDLTRRLHTIRKNLTSIISCARERLKDHGA